MLIRLKEVMARTGLSKATIYAMCKKFQFPLSVKLGPRATAWPLSEVEAWCADKIAARNGAPHDADTISTGPAPVSSFSKG